MPYRMPCQDLTVGSVAPSLQRFPVTGTLRHFGVNLRPYLKTPVVENKYIWDGSKWVTYGMRCFGGKLHPYFKTLVDDNKYNWDGSNWVSYGNFAYPDAKKSVAYIRTPVNEHKCT